MIIFKCDLCGKRETDNRKLQRIVLSIVHDIKQICAVGPVSHDLLVCKKCYKKTEKFNNSLIKQLNNWVNLYKRKAF